MAIKQIYTKIYTIVKNRIVKNFKIDFISINEFKFIQYNFIRLLCKHNINYVNI